MMKDRQLATAMYFIDRLALRAGNEKGEDEADTVGCCSLRCEHVTLSKEDDDVHKVHFDFLGKDSIRFVQDVVVEEQIAKNVRIFKKDKGSGDALYIQTLMYIDKVSKLHAQVVTGDLVHLDLALLNVVGAQADQDGVSPLLPPEME